MDSQKFKCTFSNCQAVYSRISRLEVHIRKHTGERPFICTEECGKAYTNKAHLQRHLITCHTPQESPPINCPYKDCNRILSNKSTLKKHIDRLHKRVFPHTCQVCGKGFREKHQLQAHTYHHTGEIPFKCEHCDKGFLHITSYKKHRRNHKIHTCICDRIFYSRAELLQHRRGCYIKTYTCEVCKKQFTKSSNYNTHIKIHQENRDMLKCPMENCERVYYEKKNLQYHIDVYHLKIKEHPKRNKRVKLQESTGRKRKKKNETNSLQTPAVKEPKERNKRKSTEPRKIAASEFAEISELCDVTIKEEEFPT